MYLEKMKECAHSELDRLLLGCIENNRSQLVTLKDKIDLCNTVDEIDAITDDAKQQARQKL